MDYKEILKNASHGHFDSKTMLGLAMMQCRGERKQK